MDNHLDLAKVPVHGKLVDALWSLERGSLEISLVMEKGDRLAGVLTDGDIRRALLRGASVDSPLAPFVQRNFVAVHPGAGRTEVIELMQARSINQIPVVDDEGKLVGLHLLHEMIGRAERTNWAVIMAGGRGTRLRPITDHLPKPMIPVAGRPILERLVLHLVGFGIRRIFLAINYLGHVVEEHFRTGERFGCRIEYLRETTPLGTGGALAMLPSQPSTPLVVLNGDLVTQADVGAMLEFHEQQGCEATVAVRQYSHTVPFGCVDVEHDRVEYFEEKPELQRLVNAGIYVFNPSLIGRLPLGQACPITFLLEDCLNRGEHVGAFRVVDDWVDVGQRDQLQAAREGIGTFRGSQTDS